MTHIEKVTAGWSEWVARTDPEVLATITNVQLNNREPGSSYDVHISAWNADQLVVNMLASAVGCPTNEGWEPKSGLSDRQWSLDVERGGLLWHVTATTPARAERAGE